MDVPSIGRMVHYVSYGTPGGEYPSVCRAAVITEVGGLVKGGAYPGREISSSDEVVSLAVLNPEGMFFNQGVLHDEGEQHSHEQFPSGPDRRPSGGTWHWPERT